MHAGTAPPPSQHLPTSPLQRGSRDDGPVPWADGTVLDGSNTSAIARSSLLEETTGGSMFVGGKKLLAEPPAEPRPFTAQPHNELRTPSASTPEAGCGNSSCASGAFMPEAACGNGSCSAEASVSARDMGNSSSSNGFGGGGGGGDDGGSTCSRPRRRDADFRRSKSSATSLCSTRRVSDSHGMVLPPRSCKPSLLPMVISVSTEPSSSLSLRLIPSECCKGRGS
mmetsp:Transcript_133188/g.265727  ORF Transcript_133188/g.265727 Transcript_133188/m.265727 type:complete len:225 (-) Transcript_133188:61-735(-)